MTSRRHLRLSMAALTAAAIAAAGAAAHGSAASGARLRSVTTVSNGPAESLVVEASRPVAYVATRPNPLTIHLELRNVDVQGAATRVHGGASGIADVALDTLGPSADGAGLSRVRISLLKPLTYRVRSERNTIVVDFGGVDPVARLGLDGGETAPARAPAPSSRLFAQQSAAAGGQPPAQPRYTGSPVNFDFEDADLRGVLRLFQEISGLNVVIDPEVKGSVNLVLRNVPWDQALDVILKSNKLGYVVDDTIVRIAPLGSLAEEEEQRRKLADAQAEAGDLQVVTKQLSYAKADELQALLKSILSKRGSVQIDQRTNTLIVTDLQARLKAVDDLVASLDHAQPQVEIEARIVQTNKIYARQLGVNWGFNGRVDPALGNTTGLAFPNSGSLGGRVGPTQGPNNTSTAVNLPVGAATSAVGLALGAVNGAFNLDVALSALESSGNGRILSTPRVSTLNNVEAEMTQGVQIPLQTISNNTVTVDFRDAALTLKVVPQITAADTVIMRVSLENSTPDFSRAAGPAAIPPINTQRAITTLLVNDGQTTVIGGIYTSNQQTSTDRTPGLSRIPILSWMFKRDRVDDQSNELLIFITPRIIK